jgi:hypothetical protein
MGNVVCLPHETVRAWALAVHPFRHFRKGNAPTRRRDNPPLPEMLGPLHLSRQVLVPAGVFCRGRRQRGAVRNRLFDAPHGGLVVVGRANGPTEPVRGHEMATVPGHVPVAHVADEDGVTTGFVPVPRRVGLLDLGEGEWFSAEKLWRKLLELTDECRLAGGGYDLAQLVGVLRPSFPLRNIPTFLPFGSISNV